MSGSVFHASLLVPLSLLLNSTILFDVLVDAVLQFHSAENLLLSKVGCFRAFRDSQFQEFLFSIIIDSVIGCILFSEFSWVLG